MKKRAALLFITMSLCVKSEAVVHGCLHLQNTQWQGIARYGLNNENQTNMEIRIDAMQTGSGVRYPFSGSYILNLETGPITTKIIGSCKEPNKYDAPELIINGEKAGNASDPEISFRGQANIYDLSLLIRGLITLPAENQSQSFVASLSKINNKR